LNRKTTIFVQHSTVWQNVSSTKSTIDAFIFYALLTSRWKC